MKQYRQAALAVFFCVFLSGCSFGPTSLVGPALGLASSRIEARQDHKEQVGNIHASMLMAIDDAARDKARSGDLEGALALWQKALDMLNETKPKLLVQEVVQGVKDLKSGPDVPKESE